MAGLGVICGERIADGFRLAGVRVMAAGPGPGLRSALGELLDDKELGLLLVTDDLWSSLDERTRSFVGQEPALADDDARRREERPLDTGSRQSSHRTEAAKGERGEQ